MDSRITVTGRADLRPALKQCARDLGRTADEVARKLTSLGVRGIPHHTGECALARYLKATVGAEASVDKIAVTRNSIKVWQAGRRFPFHVLLPYTCSSFVSAFDRGSYPRLVDGTAELSGRSPGLPAEP